MPATFIQPEFKVDIDYDKCHKCGRCVQQCGWGVYSFNERPIPDDSKCRACHRCVTYCPAHCITIKKNELAFRDSENWSPALRKAVWRQAESGGVMLTSMGNDKPYQRIFDHLVLDACQVTNPSIDPLREPMETRTFIGRKPDSVGVEPDGEGGFRLKDGGGMSNNIELSTPIMFGGMSYGSVSLNVHKSLAMAAGRLGITMNTGEGGLHADLFPYTDNIIVQCASGRFGVDPDYLRRGVAIEIKVGQGAKPGIGGHLPGEKVSMEISRTRMIPYGSDAISPAPHHDIYSIEDLSQLIYALKEATDWVKPVSVKIAAVHNAAAIASGVVRAGADIVAIDGIRGGTGAAPTRIRDNVGIPIELALAAVDDRLRAEGIRNRASLVVAGGVRNSGDVIKAIALGADAVYLGTSALVAMGCHVCRKCYTGKCNWGICTQDPYLTKRLNPDLATRRLVNLVNAWSHEIKEMLGGMGINAIESLRGNRLRLRGVGLDQHILDILGIKHAGE